MKIAIEGCCHGELDKIYSTIQYLENLNNIKVDLLIICGDFQSIRNEADLDAMAVPEKYREMCSFWKYYAGISKAPVLTLFIGGNHEASNYLSELPYGGWVAPNIYYMGYANVVNFGGIRIAGLSGIYKSQDFYKGHFEIMPYNKSTMHSVYHVRNLEVFRLSQIQQPIDIMLTHDWPTGIYNHGNFEQLIRFKPYFETEMRNNTLGSPENEKLLEKLKPSYWFSAHLHAKFSCIYKHYDDKNPNLVESDKKTTKFLALDKCLPHRKFLQVIDIEGDPNKTEKVLSLDPEWLAILKKTDHFLSVESYFQAPLTEKDKIVITDDDINIVKDDFQNSFEIPNNFCQTAPPHIENDDKEQSNNARNNNTPYLNEQTTLYCEMLNIRDPIRIILEKRGKSSIITESQTKLYNDLLNDSDDD